MIDAGWAMLVGAFFGIVLPFVNRRFAQAKYAVFLPSASSLGLALILNPAQAFIISVGAMFTHFWEKRNAATARGLTVVSHLSTITTRVDYSTSLASGLVAGAGLMGVMNAVLEVAGVPTLVSETAGY